MRAALSDRSITQDEVDATRLDDNGVRIRRAWTDDDILALAWKCRYDEPDASGYDFGTRSLLEFARALLESAK
jgi:hypothetical protein